MSAKAILLAEADRTLILANAKLRDKLAACELAIAAVDACYASLIVKCVAAEALADLAEATEMANKKKLDEARENETTVKQAASTGVVMVKAVKVYDTGYDDLRKMQDTQPAKPACGFEKGKLDQTDEAKTDVVDPVRIKFKVRVSSGVGVCLGVRGSFR